MKRRNFLKNTGLNLGAAIFAAESLSWLSENTLAYALPRNPLHKPLSKPVTAITIGAGSRGKTYGRYALVSPDKLNIVGVAEPDKFRNDQYATTHQIDDANRFVTWEEVFERPKFADAVIISTPDALHYEPCMRALSKGYDILLEKPIAQTEQECRDIYAMVKKTGRVVAVCHVLRYAPYFVKMKELITQGAIGELISIQHIEGVGETHMAHSYVRGNWHNSVETTPMILAKSCHDLDIIRWMVNKPCKQIAAMGGLKWFCEKNAPEGSTRRCTDGCKVERKCPYSAIKLYYDDPFGWTYVFNLPEDIEKRREVIMEKLKTTNFGRCVYRMDDKTDYVTNIYENNKWKVSNGPNDQPDHYITSMLFEDNVTASFSMEAFAKGRKTQILGSMGRMWGDLHTGELFVLDFRTGVTVKFVPKFDDVTKHKLGGHGGGDYILARDFAQAVSQQNPALLVSKIDESIESHIIGFMAEESRKQGKIMSVEL